MNDFMPLSNNFLTCNNINGGIEPAFAVATEDVFVKQAKLNSCKANGPDGAPCWLLKENADILADPVRKILNCSYSKCHFSPPDLEIHLIYHIESSSGLLVFFKIANIASN